LDSTTTENMASEGGTSQRVMEKPVPNTNRFIESGSTFTGHWESPCESQSDLLKRFQRSTEKGKVRAKPSQYIGAISACTYVQCQTHWTSSGNPYVTRETPATKSQSFGGASMWSQVIDDPERHHGSGPTTKAK
jgi:hypothetical protein